ncbi:MAG: methyl-accepting chemotaxis protein [Desulfobacteraceae bacterium]
MKLRTKLILSYVLVAVLIVLNSVLATTFDGSSNMIFLCTTAMVAACLVIGLVSSKIAVAPIKKAIEAFKTIASGKADLTKRMPMRQLNCSRIRGCGNDKCPEFGKNASCWDTVGSNAIDVHCPRVSSGKIASCHDCNVVEMAVVDEADELTLWFNTFLGGHHILINTLQASTSNLTRSATDLSGLSSRLSALASQSSEESNSVATAAEEMNTNLNQVADSTEQASTNVDVVAAASQQMTSTINEIAKSSEQANAITDDAVKRSHEASGRITALGKSANEITKVTEVITEISEQTNLLALNATIEAARAGETGKGFAVVANEIKELAGQTAEATHRIKRQIEGIQQSTAGTVEEITGIEKVISEVNDIVSTIARSIEEQSAATQEIAESIAKASQGMQEVNHNVAQCSSVSNEVVPKIAQINHSMDQISDSSANLNQNAKDLEQLGRRIDELVGNFHI